MAFSLDGDKICEVSGQVKCSSMERMARDFKPGSIALFKLSNSYYVHVVTSSKRVKFQLKTSNGKFDFSWRDSRLTLSIRQNYAKSSSSSDVSLIHLNDATPKQLQLFVESLNAIETHASFKGKLLSRDSDIQDVENKPLNSPKISKVRSKVVSSSSSPSPNRSIISNFHAKQMKPPSSYSTQKTKTPLNDQTRARDNLHNASIFKGSASSFYGSQNSRSPLIQRSGNFGKSLGPRLMPPPQPLRQTPRLSSQISFRSHYKKPFEKEVTLTGFSNLGNTCYMNAILQSLLGIPPFVQDLSNLELLDNVHPQCLYKCLYNVMLCKKKCQNAEVIRTSLRKLKRTISEAATRFSGYHQHDAHEFLCQVFDQLRDDVIACKSPLSKCSSDEINSKTNDLLCPVTRTFESKVLHVVSCKRCGETTSNEEIYHAFSIDLPSLCNQSDTSPSSINMQTLIKKQFEDEELEYTCSKCNSKEAVISHGFVRLPRVLILHLKRYGYDNFTEEQEKKEDKVNIERFIALDMMCSSNTEIPLPFLPKSSFQLSPVKSRQRPQKRHFISEDDDDDKDFQASPSTRRKLDHSFGNTIKARSTVDLLSDSKGVSDEEMGITEFCKLDSLNGYNSDVHNASEQNNKDIALENKENTADSHHLANGKPVWEASEELQMEWALAESAKSAEKKPRSDLREQSISVVEVECNENLKSHRAPVPKDSLQRKGECNDEISAFDFDDDFSDFENPVWTRSEEEQVRWALAESAKLSAEKKSVDTLKDEGRKRQRDLTNKLGSQKSLYDNCNFSLENVMSDEDLLGAEWEIHQTSEPRGLKGGGPIVTERGSGGVEHVSFLVNDENRSPQNCADSGLEKKKPPIICIKRRNGYLSRKRKNDSDVLTKTPTLGQFEGNLFESQPRDNRPPSRNSLTPSVSSTGGEKSCGLGFSSKFSDDDMEKAINISLQEQEISNVEDEELRKALELSLRDVERKCPDMEPIPPPVVIDITDSIKGRDSTPQVEGIESSTRSYRLVSIVNHLGSKSTSGHYISDVYDCNTKQWTSYDDSAATKVSEHSVRYKRQQSGYIFFYMYKQCVDAIENSTPSKENVQK